MITLYIGRSPENTIVYNEPSISGKHAELTVCDDGRILFRDYSANGTYVNGQFVNQNTVDVSFGDSIIFPGNIPFDWNQVSNALNFMAQQSQQQPQGYEQPAQGDGYIRQQPASQPGSYSEGHGQASEEFSDNVATLSFSRTISESFSIGFSHIWSCIGTLFLYLITSWVPYFSIGTFFGLQGMVNAWAKGENFSPIDLFDSKYRRLMPELLMSSSFKAIILLLGIVTVIPGIVLGIALMFSELIVIDRHYSPIEAIRESNRMSYGSKWTIFGVQIVMGLIFSAILGLMVGILMLVTSGVDIFNMTPVIVTGIILLLVFLCIALPVSFGMTASMWRQLSANIRG